MVWQSRAEIGRAGFLRRAGPKGPGTDNIASLAARLLARLLDDGRTFVFRPPPVPRSAHPISAQDSRMTANSPGSNTASSILLVGNAAPVFDCSSDTLHSRAAHFLTRLPTRFLRDAIDLTSTCFSAHVGENPRIRSSSASLDSQCSLLYT